MAQTSRERVSRIDKEYFKRPDRLTRAKRWLAGILVAISTLWLVAEVASALSGRPDSRIAYLYSRGELANPHAMWDRDCSVCHEAFSPISDQAGWLAAHVGSDSSLRCTACHAGPIHHPRMLASEAEGRCASCHQDHQGRNHPLTQMADSACTSCHANLPAHTNDSVEPIGRAFAARITSFNRDHPEFHAVETKNDPGRLRFNHALHLAKGLPKTNARGEPWFTYGHIDSRDRERYLRLAARAGEGSGDSETTAGQALDPATFVQLDCRACHVLDNADLGLSAAEQARWDVPATPEQRAYFSPIQYEQHCRGCHSLAIHAPPTPASPDGAELVQSPRLDWQIELPHGLEPSEVRQLLEHHWSWRDFDPTSPLTSPSRPFPGKRSAVPDSFEETTGERRDAEVNRLMRLLFQEGGNSPTAPSNPESANEQVPTGQASLIGQQGCTVCHQVRVEATSDLTEPVAAQTAAMPTYHLLPTNVPQVWMPHGWFDHSAHRGVRCEACHSGTRESTSAADVLLPGIENCQQCHGPSRRESGRQLGGASTRCTECHRYHNRAEPLAGIGARPRDALDPREIDSYLRGDPPTLNNPSPTQRNPRNP